MLRLLLTPLLMIALLAGSAWCEDSKNDDLDAIQQRYEKTSTLKAHFVQKARVKVLNQVQETQGQVFIKKPGKMKWHYNAPDPQILISNEDTLWLFVPEDNQVNKMSIENVYSNNTPALFLAGRGKLTDSFDVEEVQREADGIRLTLIPKDKTMNVEKMVLLADNKSFQITGSSVYDNLGNHTEILFSEIEVNAPLSDDLFEFKVPNGVEVMDFTQSQ